MKQSPDRQEKVFEEALALVAERGVRGASLRELARRLGLSQPSLYHYFKTKDELILVLAERGAAHMVDTMMVGDMVKLAPEDMAHHVKERVLELYRSERHVRYVKFLFAVAIEVPAHQSTLQRVFEQRLLDRASEELKALFARSPETLGRWFMAAQMVSRAVGLALIEDQVLFGLKQPSEGTLQFAEFVADAARRILVQDDPPA